MGDGARVAIVAVHGIADQQPRQTVLELARLLCRGGDGDPGYVQGEMQDVLIPVQKLEPGSEDHALPAVAQSREGKPRGDPVRSRPGGPSGFYETQKFAQPPLAEKAETPGRSGPDAQDMGLAMNEYLLGRLQLAQEDALYESTRVSLRRAADNRPVDVYEMYWADLSRLSSGGLKALTSLYQLFFHLATLGADIVDQVALCNRGVVGWRLLQRLHAWLAWLMKAPMALLQLCMLMMVVFGTLALMAPESQRQLLAALFAVGGIVLAALGVLGWLRGRSPLRRWAQLVPLLAAAIASLASAVVSLNAETWLHYAYFGACALVTALAGSWAIERYSGVTRGVRLPGHVLVLATLLGLCIAGWRVLGSVSSQFEWMLTAALNVSEFLLAAALLVWAVFVIVQIIALLLGLWLGRRLDAAGRASLQTARLGLVGSSSLFAVLSLVLWSVIIFVAAHALDELYYAPVLLGSGYRSGAIFLEMHVRNLGAFFTPLVLAFGGLMAAAILVLLPSLMEEIRPTRNLDGKGPRPGAEEWSQRLGTWLGRGIGGLNAAGKYLIPPGAIVGSVLYLAFFVQQVYWALDIPEPVATISGWLELLKGETLVDAGKWLAGGALTIVALGARFTQTFGRLRVAIDAVLDIDNYFADPPNLQPPRARIFSRYASLLRYLRDRGYQRIVIVAHSQGTVISADLLHYLNVQRRLGEVVGNVPVALVTVGSPLRDLYAERFPLLYRWMGSNAESFEAAGPGVDALGVVEWVNAGRAGDYVGRFLWTPPSDADRFRVATVGRDGRVLARRANGRTEFCLGAGAHTHYFSNDAIALAAEIDRLVTAS